MNPELDSKDIGSQLGADGVNKVVANVEQYSLYEEQRIALENHAPIVAMRAELSMLADEENRIQQQLSVAPPPGDLRHHRRKAVFCWAVTVILTVTGFFLALLTLAPFRLGWQAYLFCLGIAAVVPFLIEKLLQDGRLETVVKGLTAIAAAAGVASLMLLADVRGHLLAHEIQSRSAVVIDDSQSEQAPPDDFYGATLGSLRLALVLLSFAMELGAGLALREAWTKAPHGPEDWQRLRKELAAVRRQMIAAVGQITRLEDEPAIFVARLWKDFYKSMLTHTVQSAMQKLLVLAIAAALVPHARAATPQHLDLVVALDLTRSVDVKGPDGITEFQKNVDGVTWLLRQVPAGAHITVIGITDQSFAQPYILLKATVPEDTGYFGERLGAARVELIQAWKQRSAKTAPTAKGTDILGALELTSEIFDAKSNAGSRILVIFSDMRNHTRELDLETPTGLDGALKRRIANSQASLSRVQIYALGVNGVGSDMNTWEETRRFWKSYFSLSGATLSYYSGLRSIDNLIDQWR